MIFKRDFPFKDLYERAFLEPCTDGQERGFSSIVLPKTRTPKLSVRAFYFVYCGNNGLTLFSFWHKINQAA